VRVAVLVKQVPKGEVLALDATGRLNRDGVELELNAFCRRAITTGVQLAAQRGGECVVVSLGPPSAVDALREALGGGADRGVLVSDPAFAGSDTLATSRALVAALDRLGEFDLVVTGRSSVDADTGQVGPQVAELLELPFAGAVRRLEVIDGGLRVHCEHDDGWTDAEISLPAVISCAERLCEPTKVKPARWGPAERVERLTAADLGAGPWGQAGSPTSVGAVRTHEIDRRREVLAGPVAEQVATAVTRLVERGALDHRVTSPAATEPVPAAAADIDPAVAVLAAPGRDLSTRELTGAAAALAREIAGGVVVIDAAGLDPATLASWGADEVAAIPPAATESEVAGAAAAWCRQRSPWGVLAPATMWGREVAGRMAARLGAGLTGDAVELTVADGRLVCWKPAFAGRLLAAIHTSSPLQLATIRPGALPIAPARPAAQPVRRELAVTPDRRLRVLGRGRDDDIDVLPAAAIVIGVGQGVNADDYDRLAPLRIALGAELAATRKVTDHGWMPHARQLGLTGRAIAPSLYVAIGISGKFNHMVGVRSAGTVLAINRDRDALVFDHADLGIVGDWQEVVPALAAAVAEVRSPAT
jgi:electron transfer flavoprotein alpha subunit